MDTKLVTVNTKLKYRLDKTNKYGDWNKLYGFQNEQLDRKHTLRKIQRFRKSKFCNFFPAKYLCAKKWKIAEKVLNWINTKGLNLRKGSNKITLKLWHFNLNKSRESGRIVFYLIYKTDFLSFYLIFDIILLFHWSDRYFDWLLFRCEASFHDEFW